MIKIYTYLISTGAYSSTLEGDIDVCVKSLRTSEDFTLTPPPNFDEQWYWIDNEWKTTPLE